MVRLGALLRKRRSYCRGIRGLGCAGAEVLTGFARLARKFRGREVSRPPVRRGFACVLMRSNSGPIANIAYKRDLACLGCNVSSEHFLRSVMETALRERLSITDALVMSG